MIKNVLFIVIVFLSVFLIGRLNELDQECILSNHSPFPQINYCVIDRSLNKYVITFANEAYIRNIYFELNGVNILVSRLRDASAITFKPLNLILIDTTSEAWKINPESLVFHELGHLVLNRIHYENVYYYRCVNDNAIHKYPISIMHSYLTKKYDRTGMFTRRYFIDELFDTTKFAHTTNLNH